jgi:hypothetical protein
MQTMTHGGHDAKVAAAATQRPEQVLLMVVGRDDDAAVREHDLRGEQIVEGQPEAADQRAVAAAQGEARHADAADRARHRREAERIGHCEHVRGPRTARNSRRAAVGVDDHVVHAAQVDHDALAQRATCPVVAAAPHRQWKIGLTRGTKCRLDVFGRPAVDDSTRHAADRLWPDRCCYSVALIARH